MCRNSANPVKCAEAWVGWIEMRWRSAAGRRQPFSWRDFMDHVGVDDAVRVLTPSLTRYGEGCRRPAQVCEHAGQRDSAAAWGIAVVAAPAASVCAGPAGEPGYLRTPGVVLISSSGKAPRPLDERHHPADLGLRVDAPPGRLGAAHIDHVSALGDEATRGRSAEAGVGEVRATMVERVRGAVDDQ